MQTADLLFNHLDHFATIFPASTRAADWLGDTLPDGDLLFYRGAIVVSPEQINPIIAAARGAGLTVEG